MLLSLTSFFPAKPMAMAFVLMPCPAQGEGRSFK
jgi:hypothetical protein